VLLTSGSPVVQLVVCFPHGEMVIFERPCDDADEAAHTAEHLWVMFVDRSTPEVPPGV
jgi:hypothetical protein